MKNRFVDVIINGEPMKTKSMTTRSFLTSIGVSIVLCTSCVIAFSASRKRLRSVYEPRLFVFAKHMRLQYKSSEGFFGWIPDTLMVSSSDILQSSGLDAYCFLRYIVFVMSLCAISGVPLLVVSLPIHLSGNREGVSGLDRLSTMNSSESQVIRHVAHLVFCIAFTFASSIIFKSELIRYFRMRAAHIVGQDDGSPGPSSTLSIKNLNEFCQSAEDVKTFFGGVASISSATPVRQVWFNRDYTELHKLIIARRKVLRKLERQELWLIERCIGVDDPNGSNMSNGNKDARIVGNLWREYSPPRHSSEMNGKRGSEISWLKSEMSKLNSQIYQIQSRPNSMPYINSCFVQFDSKLSAFIAARSSGTDKCAGVGTEIFDRIHPADIIWSNSKNMSWLAWIMSSSATVLNYIFVFGWAIPVAFISMMAQVDTSSEVMPTVHWVFEGPQMNKLMSNVSSPLIVSGSTAQVPSIFRCLAKSKGYPTNTRVEMDVQKYLFSFMFFQLFLIVTSSTGLPVSLIQLLVDTSGSAITSANSLSKASTFFISYLMASSLTIAGNASSQSPQLLLLLCFKGRDRTPRQKSKNKCSYSTIYWGSVFPMVTNIGAIAIAYALISPAIMISAIIGLAALYIAYKYRIMYCYVPRCTADGDYYPRAIFQLFSGFYCQQVSSSGTSLSSGQLALAMIISIVIITTMISQHHSNRSYSDSKTRIPLKPQNDLEAQNAQYFVATTKTRSTKRHSQSSVNTLVDSVRGSDKSVAEVRAAIEEVNLNGVQAEDGAVADASSDTSPFRNQSASSRATTRNNNPQPNVASNDRPNSCQGSQGTNGSNATSNSHRSRASSASSIHSSNLAISEAWTGIYDAFATEFSASTAGQQDFISSQSFTHPDMRMSRPCIWSPRDWKGVAQDQVTEMQNSFSDSRSSCCGADIASDGGITISQSPPDFDPFDVIRS